MNLLLHGNYYFFFKKRNDTLDKGIITSQKSLSHKTFRGLVEQTCSGLRYGIEAGVIPLFMITIWVKMKTAFQQQFLEVALL